MQGTYLLQITPFNIVLIDIPSQSPVTEWPIQYLRRYGRGRTKFSFEAGDKCKHGKGVYTFNTLEGDAIFHQVDTFARGISMRNQHLQRRTTMPPGGFRPIGKTKKTHCHSEGKLVEKLPDSFAKSGPKYESVDEILTVNPSDSVSQAGTLHKRVDIDITDDNLLKRTSDLSIGAGSLDHGTSIGSALSMEVAQNISLINEEKSSRSSSFSAPVDKIDSVSRTSEIRKSDTFDSSIEEEQVLTRRSVELKCHTSIPELVEPSNANQSTEVIDFSKPVSSTPEVPVESNIPQEPAIQDSTSELSNIPEKQSNIVCVNDDEVFRDSEKVVEDTSDISSSKISVENATTSAETDTSGEAPPRETKVKRSSSVKRTSSSKKSSTIKRSESLKGVLGLRRSDSKSSSDSSSLKKNSSIKKSGSFRARFFSSKSKSAEEDTSVKIDKKKSKEKEKSKSEINLSSSSSSSISDIDSKIAHRQKAKDILAKAIEEDMNRNSDEYISNGDNAENDDEEGKSKKRSKKCQRHKSNELMDGQTPEKKPILSRFHSSFSGYDYKGQNAAVVRKVSQDREAEGELDGVGTKFVFLKSVFSQKC